MYKNFFGFTESPFSLTPDPRFLFMGQRHREALAHLLYGMGDAGGFVLLTGEVGTGKTTLCRSLLEQVPEGVNVALVLNPKQTSLELVASICDELGIPYPSQTQSLKVLVDRLNQHLLETHAKGRRTVLIIDEAQNLSADVLEQIRLLTNLETTTQKLLQIILIGQPELQDMMRKPELRQLAQRITATCHLTPLKRAETLAYIQHRLDVAGRRRRIFSKSAERLIHRLSGGIPRIINALCDRALLGAYAGRKDRVGTAMIRRAAFESLIVAPVHTRRRWLGWGLAAAILILLVGGWHFLERKDIITWFRPTVPIVPQETSPQSRSEPLPPEEKKEPDAAQRNTGDLAMASIPAEDQERDQTDAVDAEVILPLDQNGDVEAELPIIVDLSLETWLLQNGPSDMPTAFRTLLRCWNVEAEDIRMGDPCETAARAGLRCMKGSGNWTSLKKMNRPAILELVDSHGKRHYLTAVALTEKEITLEADGLKTAYPLSEVERLWYGPFTILWKPPPHGISSLKRGDRGPQVRWLREILEKIEGAGENLTSLSPKAGVFDEELEERIISFQRNHGLNSDGIVGEQTFMQLNEASGDPGIPRLYSRGQGV